MPAYMGSQAGDLPVPRTNRFLKDSLHKLCTNRPIGQMCLTQVGSGRKQPLRMGMCFPVRSQCFQDCLRQRHDLLIQVLGLASVQLLPIRGDIMLGQMPSVAQTESRSVASAKEDLPMKGIDGGISCHTLSGMSTTGSLRTRGIRTG